MIRFVAPVDHEALRASIRAHLEIEACLQVHAVVEGRVRRWIHAERHGASLQKRAVLMGEDRGHVPGRSSRWLKDDLVGPGGDRGAGRMSQAACFSLRDTRFSCGARRLEGPIIHTSAS